jgi:hypothetical protein
MKSFLRHLLIEKRDRFVTLRTSPQDLELLIRRLHPVNCGSPLIRLGPEGDGGYLIPDALNGIVACFSPGVSLISGFENDCASRGIEIYMADASVDAPALANQKFHFIKRFIGGFTDSEFLTLADWVADSRIESTGDLILQIDVEGFEYEIFLSTPHHLLKRFRIIVAEFHDINQLLNKPFFSLASRTFEKILLTHSCVHIHPNNCGYVGKPWPSEVLFPAGLEFTFVRNDYIKNPSYRTDFPHALDFDNTSFTHLPLHPIWFRSV